MDTKYIVPRADIYEDSAHFYIRMDMPGTSKDNIDITTDSEKLIITGKLMDIDQGWKPVMKEYELYDYKRSFIIGNKIKRENIQAKYDNGILSLDLEKSDSIKPKKIEVQISQ